MCEKRKGCPNTIDKCMRYLIAFISENTSCDDVQTLGCCCGHGRYPMTIVYKETWTDKIFDLMSGIEIPRKHKFYKRDKKGFYFIPGVCDEVLD